MEDKEFQCLLKEYELFRSSLQFGIGHRLKGLAFILSAITVALSIGDIYEIPFLPLLIPWFIIVSVAYLGYQLFCTKMIIAYLCKLEKRLKVLDYQRSFSYELYSKPSFLKNPAKLLFFISCLPFFLIFIYCLYLSYKWLCNRYNCTISSLYSIITFAIAIVVVVVVFWGAKNASCLPKNRFNNCSGENITIESN